MDDAKAYMGAAFSHRAGVNTGMYVDRFLYTPMRYPGNYGFVPHTLSEDGDPIDVLIANTRPLVPGCVMSCRPVGVLVMADEKGQDEKIVAVPSTRITRRPSPCNAATCPAQRAMAPVSSPRPSLVTSDEPTFTTKVVACAITRPRAPVRWTS